MKLQSPYLIQRGKVKTEFKPDLLTSNYLNLDYMGSAEFEFGAIPQFQRNVNDKIKQLHIFLVEHNGINLFFASTHEQTVEYSNYLKEIIDQKIRLGERSGIKEKEIPYVGKKASYDQPHAPYKFDVFLDLTNNLFFARTEATTKNLFVTIPNSVRYMDETRKKA